MSRRIEDAFVMGRFAFIFLNYNILIVYILSEHAVEHTKAKLKLTTILVSRNKFYDNLALYTLLEFYSW